jgi:hypothetical protein
VTPRTEFLTGPEESTTPFVEGIHHTHGEKANTHGMREQGSEDRIDEDKAATNGKRATMPSREACIAF